MHSVVYEHYRIHVGNMYHLSQLAFPPYASYPIDTVAHRHFYLATPHFLEASTDIMQRPSRNSNHVSESTMTHNPLDLQAAPGYAGLLANSFPNPPPFQLTRKYLDAVGSSGANELSPKHTTSRQASQSGQGSQKLLGAQPSASTSALPKRPLPRALPDQEMERLFII